MASFYENNSDNFDIVGLTRDEVLALRSRLGFEASELLEVTVREPRSKHYLRALEYETRKGDEVVEVLRKAIPRLDIPATTPRMTPHTHSITLPNGTMIGVTQEQAEGLINQLNEIV